jgi:glycosyltransferase involved in cell wall biosynthesis
MSVRVVHVASSLDLRSGGPAVALAGLAIGQQRAGLQVSVVATFREGDDQRLDERLRREGVALTSIGPCTGRLARHTTLQSAVARCVKAADVVHIHALFEEVQYLAARLAWENQRPYVIRPCGMLDPWSLRRSWLIKRLYLAWRLHGMLRRATAIHYTTEFERRGAAALGLNAAVFVEPNGLDITEYQILPSGGSFRTHFDIPSDVPLIAFLGRVHPGKGVDHLVRALAHPLLTRARLAVVGPDSGGYLAAIKRLVDTHRVADRVVFTGLLSGDERLAALVDADLFSLPSDHENFGIAVAEAMAVGKPVIVSPEVGMADDVTAAGAGGVVHSDPEPLATELASWLENPSRRAEAGHRAREFALERYDWIEIGRRWRNHYQSWLEPHVSSRRVGA